MFRTALFPYWNSRLRKGVVKPVKLFEIMHTAMRIGVRDHVFRLPTLSECVDVEATLPLTIPPMISTAPAATVRRRIKGKTAVPTPSSFSQAPAAHQKHLLAGKPSEAKRVKLSKANVS